MSFLSNNKNTRKWILILIALCLSATLLHITSFLSISFGKIPDEEVACRLPKLDPFDRRVKKYMKNHALDCTKGWKNIFETDLDSNLIITSDYKENGFRECCYRNFYRKEKNDKEAIYSKNCTAIIDKITKIPTTHDFISIFCKKEEQDNGTLRTVDQVVDMFGFVHPKPTKSFLKLSKNIPKKMNVVILGLDSVSHMNFIRTMPKTYVYLKSTLEGFGMSGYTKVGRSTFPNLVAVLTGLSVDELKLSCWKNENEAFDNCPFLWRNFSSRGYVTYFGEDAPGMAMFNYLKKGFKNPPTDYYLRPLALEMEKGIGHHPANAMHCYGPRLAFSVLLDQMMKMAVTMKRSSQPYFQLIWASSLTHDYLNYPRLGDEPLVSMLKWFKDNGHLENTAFILMSDHGMNLGAFRASIRQGRLEDKLPFLYFILPKSFREKYSFAVEALERNSKILSSPFDLHETLVDLLDPESMVSRHKNQNRRGISHFKKFSANRTCADAGISKEWCVCGAPDPSEVFFLDPDGGLIKNAGELVVKKLNSLLAEAPPALCQKLKLGEVLQAEMARTGAGDKKGVESLILVIKTLPGDATFEATFVRKRGAWEWKLVGEISRINLYGSQSHCVHSSNLKPFCFCAKQL